MPVATDHISICAMEINFSLVMRPTYPAESISLQRRLIFLVTSMQNLNLVSVFGTVIKKKERCFPACISILYGMNNAMLVAQTENRCARPPFNNGAHLVARANLSHVQVCRQQYLKAISIWILYQIASVTGRK